MRAEIVAYQRTETQHLTLDGNNTIRSLVLGRKIKAPRITVAQSAVCAPLRGQR
jgi:hypothetical protein